MIFSIFHSFYLSQQSRKKLTILIDELEIHLHPKLQQKLVALLLEFSKSAQIFISNDSPLLVKQLLENEKVKIFVMKKENKNQKGNENHKIKIAPIKERKLLYLSVNEIKYTLL